jgi:hypothetical protein
MPRRSPRIAAPLALAATLLAAACGPAPSATLAPTPTTTAASSLPVASTGPSATPVADGCAGVAAGPASPAPTGPAVTAAPAPAGTPADATAVYGAVAQQVEALRELKPTADVSPVLIDADTLRANLTKDFDASNPPAVIDHSQRELSCLGLLPAGTSLRTAVLELQSGQVAGYYSPEQNELFVVSKAGGIGPLQRLVYAHEFTHQLQDQHFDLGGLGLNATDQSDRSLARLSLVEGDAVSVQTSWMLTLSSDELLQVAQESLDPVGLEALARAPVILQETSLFPYTGGQGFVQFLMSSGGYGSVNAAFANPPASTEQVIHPEKYAAREVPVEVKPASGLEANLGAGWSEAARDTLGEEVLSVWLRIGGVPVATATAAAAGWGGDRLVLFVGPGGASALAIESAWDSPADANEFVAAATAAIAHLHLHGAIVHLAGSTKVSISIAPDDLGAQALAAALPG